MTIVKRSQMDKKQSRGLVSETEPRFLVIGVIRKPHGVGGEVSVFPQTDMPARFKWLEQVYLSKPKAAPSQPIQVKGVRFHKELVLVRLAGINSREAAGRLRGMWVQVTEDEAIPLEEEEYFLYELLGLEVVAVDGQLLGNLTEIIETGANHVFVVRGEQGEVLLPDIDEVILEIDFSAGIMKVDPLVGLL